MGKIIKAFMASGIAGVVFMYLLGSAYVDGAYGGRISALERDKIAYDLRKEQVYRQLVSLQETQVYLNTRLVIEKENARLRESGKANQTAGEVNPPTLNNSAVWQNIPPTQAVTAGQTADQANNAITQQLQRLAELKQKSSTTTSRKVTSAS